MAFIKRSTIIPVNAKVGKQMNKCSLCGMPFVSKISTNLCKNCIAKDISVDKEDRADLDQE